MYLLGIQKIMSKLTSSLALQRLDQTAQNGHIDGVLSGHVDLRHNLYPLLTEHPSNCVEMVAVNIGAASKAIRTQNQRYLNVK
jgi:hypothetical protein